jgi:sugar/nucleoside kinase (ribokinase family)
VDAPGDLIAESLRVAGVTPRLARDDELPTGVAVALLEDGMLGVVAARGANARLTPADVPEPLDADALFVSGFALLQADSAPAAWAAFDRFPGRWAGVDLAAPGLAADADLDAISGSARVVFATAAEARAATGAEPEDAVRELANRFAVACVKLGADGALAAEGDVVEHRVAPAVERLRPFGAGDAFAAAFLIARARGEPLGDALEQACSAGAQASQRP